MTSDSEGRILSDTFAEVSDVGDSIKMCMNFGNESLLSSVATSYDKSSKHYRSSFSTKLEGGDTARDNMSSVLNFTNLGSSFSPLLADEDLVTYVGKVPLETLVNDLEINDAGNFVLGKDDLDALRENLHKFNETVEAYVLAENLDFDSTGLSQDHSSEPGNS